MAGAGGGAFMGAIGGEATAGAATSRETTGAETGSGACTAGFATRVSLSFPLRLPNTMALHAGDLLLGPQLLDQRRQQRTLRLLGLAAAGEPLRDLQEHLGGAMRGGDFRDHLAVVGGRTEYLRLERYSGDRVVFDRLGELGGGDLRPLRDADLIEAVERGAIVRPRCLQQVVDVLGVAQIGKIGRRDDQDVVGRDQGALGPS